MLRNTLNKPLSSRVVKEKQFVDKLPKVIHQIAIDYTNLPKEIEDNIQLLKSLNPGWEYKYHDNQSIQTYIVQYYPEIVGLYNKISPVYNAAKADLFRYLLLYNEGGVYLDLKSTITKPLDEVLKPDDVYILSHWSNDVGEPHEGLGLHQIIEDSNPRGEFQQWYIISAKGHPFLKSVIDNVCHNIKQYNPFIHSVGGWAVLNVTGPIAYTLAINSIKDQWPHRAVNSNKDVSFVYSIYEMQGLGFRHHVKLNKKHYIGNKEPVITQPFLVEKLYRLIAPMARYLKMQKLRLKNKLS